MSAAKKVAAERRAWDADALIGWIGCEADKQEVCEPVIRAAERGEVELVLSTLALAEVIKLKHGHVPVPMTAQMAIEQFFKRQFIRTRNLDPATATLARMLVWNNGIDPKDAVHCATALRAGVKILETFDKGLLRCGTLIASGYEPLAIRKPFVENDQQEFPLAH